MIRAAVVCLLVLAVTAVDVHVGGVLTAGDPGTQAWFVAHRGPGVAATARAVSVLGTPAAKAVVVLVVGAGLLARRRWRHALLLAGAVLLTSTLTTAVKHAVDTARPPRAQALAVEASPAFPSGHVSGVVVLTGLLAWFALGATTGRATRVTAVALAVTVDLLTGLSPLSLGVHWLSDVLGGALLGSVVLLAAVSLDRVVLSGPSAPLTDTG